MDDNVDNRLRLSKLIKDELAGIHDEQELLEQVLFAGPLSLIGMIDTSMSRNRGGSSLGKRPNKDRQHALGHKRIILDYFSPNSTYAASDFRKRYRMTRRLFQKILSAVCVHDSYFQQRRDAAKKMGLSGLQKITAALRQLACGIGADTVDEYCRIAESTARESLYRFVRAIRELYEHQYLRKPNATDLQRLFSVNGGRGFPGMIASLDCMHYEWKNCPEGSQGQFIDQNGKKSIVLEAIADQEFWFWHALFGLPGGSNDISVLERSPLVNSLREDHFQQVQFIVNGTEYLRPYLLVDGIYPEWSCFVTTIPQPQTEKKSYFAACHEDCQKDVERAFGVLQARWGIVRQPTRTWDLQRATDILMACVILHNMIIEDERGEPHHEDFRLSAPIVQVQRGTMPWQDSLTATTDLESQTMHKKLRKDLIEHLWAMKSSFKS